MIWYGAEALGNTLAKKTPSSTASVTTIARTDAIAEIKRDYDQCYFVSGEGDLMAYDTNCVFADPFASFSGTARFKNNVGNLGSLLSDVQLDIVEWKEDEDSLTTKWRFSGILEFLPWSPRLAAAGGTVHVFDNTSGLVIKHIESWDVEPAMVVLSLLKPSSKTPRNAWDAIMFKIYNKITAKESDSSRNKVSDQDQTLSISDLGAHYFTQQDNRPIILFDGVCNLCNNGVKFMLDNDRQARCRFAALQSHAGATLLRRAGRSPDDISSIVFVEEDQSHIKSEAILRIAQCLDSPFPLLASLGLLVPLQLRDFVYDIIANNRYQLLGKSDMCRMKDDKFADRFITTE